MKVSSHALALALVGVALGATSSQAFVPASCQNQIHQAQHQSHHTCPLLLQAAPNGSDNANDERAGRGGYSVLRQPLSWDDESDPTFAPPKSLDEDDDAAGKRSNVDWFHGARNRLELWRGGSKRRR